MFRSRLVVLDRIRLRGPCCNPRARRGRGGRAPPSIRGGGTRRAAACVYGRRSPKGIGYRAPIDIVRLEGASPRSREPARPRFLLDSLPQPPAQESENGEHVLAHYRRRNAPFSPLQFALRSNPRTTLQSVQTRFRCPFQSESPCRAGMGTSQPEETRCQSEDLQSL